MKKYRWNRSVSILLALLVLLSFWTPAVYAASGDSEQTESTESIAWLDNPAEYRENLLSDAPDYKAGCDTALLIELNSGIVVYSKNAEETVYPASLTKIMTCLLALQYAQKDLDQVVTVSEAAVAGIAEAGGEVKLQVGERLPLRDVLYYLMVASANEAANVVAEYVGGDIPTFIQLMNKTAKDLGCEHTSFVNAHGLHDPSHFTTAKDLSIITREALTYELFREIVSTPEYTVKETNLSPAKKLKSTNYLIRDDGNRYLSDGGNYYTYYYDKAKGIKTGYTRAAGRCVISRATDGNMDLLCVILGAQTRMMSDGSIRLDSFVEAKKLFNYGFKNFAYAKVAVAKIDPMIQVPVQYSQDKRGVVLVPSGDVNCLLPKEYEKDKVTVDYQLKDDKLTAPLEQGAVVGTLSVYYNGVKVGDTELETLTAVTEKPIEHAIADITGSDKPEEERTILQKIISRWYIPVLVIAGLFVLLVLRNVIHRSLRRRAVRRRRQQEREAGRGRSR